MGQYFRGDKIGTCENMYYLTLREAQKMAALGLADDDGITFEEMLKDNTTRFRFAWPNEDNLKGNFVEREQFKTFNLPCPIEINHDEITVHSSHKNKGHGINIWIPCPHSKEFNLKTSVGGAGEQFINVIFQAIRDGVETTIFACSRCGNCQRFSSDEIKRIKNRALEYFSVYTRENGNKDLYEYALEVIERIR